MVKSKGGGGVGEAGGGQGKGGERHHSFLVEWEVNSTMGN